MQMIRTIVLTELLEAWEAQAALENEPHRMRRETLRECADMLRMLVDSLTNSCVVDPDLPPRGDGPRALLLVEVSVPTDWETRLDMQSVLERELEADRWSWRWPTSERWEAERADYRALLRQARLILRGPQTESDILRREVVARIEARGVHLGA